MKICIKFSIVELVFIRCIKIAGKLLAVFLANEHSTMTNIDNFISFYIMALKIISAWNRYGCGISDGNLFQRQKKMVADHFTAN